MRLGGDDDRSNVEDRRGLITGGRLGIGGLLLLGVLSIVFRQNFFALVGDDGTTSQAPGPQADQRRQAEAPLERVCFMTKVLDDSWPSCWVRTWRCVGRQH